MPDGFPKLEQSEFLKNKEGGGGGVLEGSHGASKVYYQVILTTS